jgi:hypothetical protein
VIIRIIGPVVVFGADDVPLSDTELLQQLDGAQADDICGNYLDNDLTDLGITGGTVTLRYDASAGQLHVVTEYQSPARLKAADLERLVADTRGQWSDGIGEGCFDELGDRLGVRVDLAPCGQEGDIRTEQVKGGGKRPKSATALAKAAREGDLETVRTLLNAGGDIEACQRGFRLLHLAVLGGHAEVALELIARGADIHALDMLQGDALMNCALSNQISDADAARVARALLERGADVHKQRGEPGLGQYTPLYMAKNRKKHKLAAVLREFGAKK